MAGIFDVFDPENVRWPTVGRWAAGGALTGASAASLLSLLHMLRQAADEKKQQADRMRTSEDTIVLTLPRPRTKSAADATKDMSEPVDGKNIKPRIEGQVNKVKKLTAKGQLRHFDGQFGSKGATKQANWQTLTAAIVAALGSGALSYSLIDKLYTGRRLNEKRRMADQARMEYMDMLRPKTAAQRSFNTLDYPLAAAMLSLMLGAGGTAYLTKRILDEYAQDTARQGKDPMAPQVRRIVFKTAEADSDPEIVSEKVAALVGIYLDICSGKPSVLGDEKCAKALADAGLDAAGVYKMAAYQDDYASLLATLEANPKLRQLIQRVAAEKHPILGRAKWLLNMPGVKGRADRELYSAVDKALGPSSLKAASAEKQAKMPLVSGAPGLLSASILGSEIAESAAERGKAKALRRSRLEKRVTPEERADQVLQELTVATTDPNAAAFVEANGPALKILLKELALAGRI